MPRSGFAGATTAMPSAMRRSTTPFQPEASAKAPCTSTTVTESELVSGVMRAPGSVVIVARCVGRRFAGVARTSVRPLFVDRKSR